MGRESVPPRIRIGTRKSALALVQTEAVRAALQARWPGVACDIVPIVTTGDTRQGTASAAVKDKREWIQEIEEAIVRAEVDIAVHSAKDVPVDVHGDTTVQSVLPRAVPYDLLIHRPGTRDRKNTRRGLAALPPGITIGTASVRRGAEIRRLRPDLRVVPVRGNVPTRLARVGISREPMNSTESTPADQVDALVLAQCGVERLGFVLAEAELLAADEMLPAVNQGILAVQFLRSSTTAHELLSPLEQPTTAAAFAAERAVVRTLGADCYSAVGVLFEAGSSDEGILRARVCSPEGYGALERTEVISLSRGRDRNESFDELGRRVGEILLRDGAGALLASWGGEPHQ